MERLLCPMVYRTRKSKTAHRRNPQYRTECMTAQEVYNSEINLLSLFLSLSVSHCLRLKDKTKQKPRNLSDNLETFQAEEKCR